MPPTGDVPEDVLAAWNAQEPVEPPAMLDQAVLNRARAAVEPAATKRPWSFGWLHATTTAAVMVLGVTLFLELRDEAPNAGDGLELREQRMDSRGTARSMESIHAESKQEVERVRDLAPGGDLDTAPAAAMEPAQERVAEEALPQAAPAKSNVAEERPTLRKRLEMANDEAAPTQEDAAAAAVFSADIPTPSPEAWLEDIRELLEAGEPEAARASFAAFQEAWPDHPIPEDLEDLLP